MGGASVLEDLSQGGRIRLTAGHEQHAEGGIQATIESEGSYVECDAL